MLGIGVAVVHVLLASLAAAHVVMNKQQAGSAMAWIGVLFSLPLVGVLAYVLFGINRVQRRARKIHQHRPAATVEQLDSWQSNKSRHENAAGFVRASMALTGEDFSEGNRLKFLERGDEAYPLMQQAIEAARSQVWLMSYLFDDDAAGEPIIDALIAAHERGVEVRVIMDGMGVKLAESSPAVKRLRAHGVAVAEFLPLSLLPLQLKINLRNHRKLLVIDNSLAFAGGLNIGKQNITQPDRRANRDVSVAIAGPVVERLAVLFAEDWQFCLAEEIQLAELSGNSALLEVIPGWDSQSADTNVVVDEPSSEVDRVELLLCSMAAIARQRLCLISPYFLPPEALRAALVQAALRGTKVQIMLPKNCDHQWMNWAAIHGLHELLRHGVELRFQPGSFVHTKLYLMDEELAMFGSSNIDVRSFRLNFELMINSLDKSFAARCQQYFDEHWQQAKPYDLADREARSKAVRLRDALCWLPSPYL